MKLHRAAPVLSVMGALILGVGAASAAGLGPIGSVPDVRVAGPVLAGPVSQVTQPVSGAVAGVTGAVAAPAQSVVTPVQRLVTPRSRTTAAGTTTPPPPGAATANGAHVNPLDTCISCTGAGAQGGSSQASATGLRVLGQPLSGGSSSSSSTGSGNLLALPTNPVLALAIADWMTAAQASGGSSWRRPPAAPRRPSRAPRSSTSGWPGARWPPSPSSRR